MRPGDDHVTVADFEVDADQGGVVDAQRASRSRRRRLATDLRSTGPVYGDDCHRVKGVTHARVTGGVDARQSVRGPGWIEPKHIAWTRGSGSFVQMTADSLAFGSTPGIVSDAVRYKPLVRLT